MRVFEELLHEPARAGMVPEFILERAAQLAAKQSEARAQTSAADQAAIRRGIVNALGLERIPQSDKVTFVEKIVESDHIVEKFVFEATPGLLVPALLYLPLGPGPHPAVVHPPGHWMEDAKLAGPIQQFNLHLVRNGLAVLCYDTIGQGERRVGWHQHGQLAPLLAGFTTLGLMVRDSLAALDILEARDDIDSDRLGMAGASGGGFSTIFSSVIDGRIKAAVVSSMANTHVSQIRDAAYGTGWDSWVDLCNQVPGMCAVGSMGDIMAATLPESLMMANAVDDPPFPLAGAREVVAEVREILDLMGKAERFTYSEVPGGHGFGSPHMRAAVAEFLVAKLCGREITVAEFGGATFASPWPIPHNVATAERPQLRTAAPSRGTCLPEPTDSNAPVVALARERARQLRETRSPLTAESLRSALGPFPEAGLVKVRVSNHLSLESSHAQRLTIETEPGIVIDAILILPENWTDDLPPVLVALDDGGKEQALNSAEVSYARQQGWAVLLPDLRGTGESAVSEFEVASGAWMLDRDLLNQRVWDALRVVDFLSTRYSSAQQIDKGRIIMTGENASSLVAMVAAALDPRIAGVATRGITSLEELMVQNSLASPMLFHYNLLESLDLADLQQFIQPRPAQLGFEAEDAGSVLEALLAV